MASLSLAQILLRKTHPKMVTGNPKCVDIGKHYRDKGMSFPTNCRLIDRLMVC